MEDQWYTGLFGIGKSTVSTITKCKSLSPFQIDLYPTEHPQFSTSCCRIISYHIIRCQAVEGGPVVCAKMP